MRVLHLPTDVGGNAWNLSRGERQLGFSSDVFVTSASRFNYRHDILLKTSSIPGFNLLSAMKAFYSFHKKYDVFHFNCGTTLIDIPSLRIANAELPFYSKKKKLFVTYNGSDARLRLRKISPEEGFEEAYLAELNGALFPESKICRLKKKIEKTARYVDHIWSVNPDIIDFLPKGKTSYIPYTPQLPGFKKSNLNFNRRKLSIVHAPTSPLIKGTKYVLKAIEQLEQRYKNDFEFTVISGLTHKEALEAYRSADVLIDQLVLGWYGGVAVEAMSMGIPVVVNMDPSTLNSVPEEMRNEALNTLISATPSSLATVLSSMIEDRRAVVEASRRSLAFVRKWHDPVTVAKMTTAHYNS